MSESTFEGSIFGSGKGDGPDIPENDKISETESSKTDLFEILSRLKGLGGDEDENDEESDLDADEYHNKAVDKSRGGKKREAAKLCMEGLEKFPLNVDLLADTINYSYESGETHTASKYYTILKTSVPFRRWNWRAFTFAFDYLLKTDPIANEEECRTIVENYKRFLPYEENASIAESELEAALGNAERSLDVLREAIQTHANASQCALCLADMQMDRGLFNDVVVTTNYGIAASAEAQPSINVPYLYYLRALARDHILHRKECVGETVTTGEVEAMKEEYEMLLSEFPELICHSRTIRMRIKMLQFIRTE